MATLCQMRQRELEERHEGAEVERGGDWRRCQRCRKESPNKSKKKKAASGERKARAHLGDIVRPHKAATKGTLLRGQG